MRAVRLFDPFQIDRVLWRARSMQAFLAVREREELLLETQALLAGLR